MIAWDDRTTTTTTTTTVDTSKKESIYQHDFCSYLSNSKLLTGRANIESNKPISVYEYAYGDGEPKAEVLSSVRLETYHRLMNKARAKSNIPSERQSVANCLVWQNAKKINNEPQANPDIRPKTVAVFNDRDE